MTEPANLLPAAAQAEIEAIIQPVLGDVFPAAALAVIRNGEMVLNAAWGWIDADSRQFPAATETRFDLASVTKIFTTTAFLSLAAERGLALETPLVEIVPEFGASGPRAIDGGQDPHTKERLPTPEWARGQMVDPARVTFYHLLTHTSGMAPWRDVFNAAGPAPTPPDRPDPLGRAERWSNGLRAICGYPFVGQPGEGVVRYSDLGLMLLGEATARLHRADAATDAVDLEQTIRARVLDPLGLKSVLFNPVRGGIDRSRIAPTENDPSWRGRRVWGEVHDENACGVGGVAGHAGLFATAHDVAMLGQAWLENDSRLSSATEWMETAKRQHAETDGARRGLGWALRAVENPSASEQFSLESYGHTGFTGTSLWIDPQQKLVVTCLTNSVYPGREKGGTHEFRRAIHAALARATA